MPTTTVHRHIAAPRGLVFRMILDPQAIAQWKAPDDMSLTVHEFEPHEGGRVRISLTYHDAAVAGKSAAHTDTYHGRFTSITLNERIVEEDEFESADPALAGTIISTITLADADGGTDLVAVHEGLPPGVWPLDNETGWRMALEKLAALAQSQV
jgi:uncharacterized protein YndB with AHSA1/START domain